MIVIIHHEHLSLDGVARVILGGLDMQRELVLHVLSIFIKVYKTIVFEEVSVAFETVPIVDLLSFFHVGGSFDDETFLLFRIVPPSVLRSLGVEHVCKWHLNIGLDVIDSGYKIS